MANLVVTFGNTDEVVNPSRLVYADISMTASPASIRYKDIYQNDNFIAQLTSDNSSLSAISADFFQKVQQQIDDGEIALSSILKQNKIQDPHANDINYIKAHVAEYVDDAWLSTGYVMQDPSTTIGGKKQGRLTLYSDMFPNTESIKQNAELRKRAHYKLEKNINVNAIKQSLRNIFSWIPGQRILNPEFGSNLKKLLYEGITENNKERIMAEIRKCITIWEPRVQLEKVVDKTTVNDAEENTVKIDIVYTIPSLSLEQYSYTYEVTKSQ